MLLLFGIVGFFVGELFKSSRNKTQLQVQMDTGIEQALLSKYESGKRIPPTETLMTLAEYFNVSMDYIMKRTDVPEVNKNN